MNNQQNKFSYDDKEHIYHLNGKIIPSCTQILREEGISNYDFCDESDLMFGKAGHKITELWDKCNLDIETVDEMLYPYLLGYQKFLKDFKVSVLPEWIEKPAYSLKFEYGVTPDRVAMVNGKLSVYEIKFSSSLSKSTAIQTAAQKIAVEEQSKLKIKQRIGLRLAPNSYDISFYNKPTDERVFLSAVILNKYKKGI